MNDTQPHNSNIELKSENYLRKKNTLNILLSCRLSPSTNIEIIKRRENKPNI